MIANLRFFKKCCIWVGLNIIAQFSFASEPWNLSESNGVTTISMEKEIIFQQRHPRAILGFSSKGGRDGALELFVKIQNISECKGFDFDEFNGPTAPAIGDDLMVVRVISNTEEMKIGMGPSGSYCGEEGDSFKFSASSKKLKGNKVFNIIKAIAKEGGIIKIEIHDYKNKSNFLFGEFLVEDKIAFARLLDTFNKGK